MTPAFSFLRASLVLLAFGLARFRAPLFCPFKTFVSVQYFASIFCFERRYVVVAIDRRTMAMDAAILNDLSTFTKEQTAWKCQLLVDDLDEQGCPIKTDLVPYLYPNPKVQFEKEQFHGFPPKSWYRFTAKYNGMDGRNVLIKAIKESANESGFILVNSKK
jgi:hypothetical protein